MYINFKLALLRKRTDFTVYYNGIYKEKISKPLKRRQQNYNELNIFFKFSTKKSNKMSRLSYAAKIWKQPHRLANTLTTLIRVISTTAPKPNFSNHEMPLANEAVNVLAKSEGLIDSSGPNKSNNNNLNDVVPADEAKPKEDKLPEMTIVDINSGYGRMDFEDRMAHMDLEERINEAKQNNNSALPLVRTMPTVVNINGYGDDMMYENMPDLILPRKITTKLAEETEDGAAANPVDDGAVSAVPMAAEAVQAAKGSKQETIIDAEEAIKAIGVDNATSEQKFVAASSTKGKNAIDNVEVICEAPVDIDAFANEEEKKQGTVDIDAYGDDERFKLPPIPKERNNVFEFKGIKIIMPKRMLRDSTYRYRLDPNDKDKADDMQICVYEK